MRQVTAMFAFALALFVAGPAAAQTVPHLEKCDCVITDLTANSMSWIGVGNATHFGKYSIIGYNEFDAEGRGAWARSGWPSRPSRRGARSR